MTHSHPSRSDILGAARLVDVSVAEMPLRRAIARAQRHYNQRNPEKRPADLVSDPHFLERITVNYLRHVCSHYDATRDFLRGIADPATRNQAGAIIKGRQLADIARKYPVLADEARRQAEWEDSKRTRTR